MTETKNVWLPKRRNIGEEVRCVLCMLGVAAELLVAAGGDGPAPSGVGAPMYGFSTGVAIVGWWWATAAIGEMVNALKFCTVNGSHSGWWVRLPWGRLVLCLLVVALVIVVRIWQPVPPVLVISN